MKSIPETEKSFSGFTYESFAFWVYILGVAMTAFGPVVHYISWVLTLICLAYGRIRYRTPLSVMLEPLSRKIIYSLILFLLWSMFAHAPHIDSFYIWGKGASIPLELLIGLYLAMKLLDTSEKRRIFGLAVVIVNLIFCFDVMFRPNFQLLGWNGSLDNGNAVALYSLLTMPFFFCYAFWFFEKNNFIKYLLCTSSLLLIFFSFSSGGWLTAFFQILIFICYALISKKVSIKGLCIFGTLFCMILMIFFCSYGKEYLGFFKREVHQMTSINNSEVLTNHRIYIWKAGVMLASEHLITGSGWGTFEDNVVGKFDYLMKKVKYKGREHFVQPHNMYISILYAGGIPALFLFLIAFAMSLKKAWSGLRYDAIYPDDVPWHLICFIVMVSMAIYGTNGDVFEARRDIGVFFGACWGVLLVIRESDKYSDKGDKIESSPLC